MKLKTLACLLGLASAVSANANDHSLNLGDIAGAPTFPVFFTHDPGSFVDTFFFEIGTVSIGSLTVADFAVAGPGGSFVQNIDGGTLNVWFSEDTGTIGADDGETSILLGHGNYVSFQAPIGPGFYFLKVTGNANGALGGIYGGQAMAVPVPEADEYAMWLAGLGIMGAIVRRRKII
jgi:hypothetical protein